MQALHRFIKGALALAIGGCGFASKPQPLVTVLRSREDPASMTVECPEARCKTLYLEDPVCDDHGAAIVIVSGHSLPPLYLNHEVEVLADHLACLTPRLIVLDTCYGMSQPLLGALVARGVDAVLVGVNRPLPVEGLAYDTRLFTAPYEASHSEYIKSPTGYADLTPQRWEIEGAGLRTAQAFLDSWSPERLRAGLRHIHPNLVSVEISGTGVEIVVPVEPARF